MPIATINPATGETLRTFDALTDAELDDKIAHAARTFRTYRRTRLAERAAWLLRAAEILEAEQGALGRLMTTEMGKLVKAGGEEAVKCAWGCRFYAEQAPRMLADKPAQSTATKSFVRYQPLGPILAVMPWNFPFWQVFRLAAPALMAGNVVLLKHASNVPQCALAIEDIVRRAGFPDGAFQTLLIPPGQVQRVLDDPRVAAVSLTGSEQAGRSIAAAAGRQIKKTVLELGGSDPFIVMPSADMPAAIETAVKARVVNSGQSCIAAKRFIVAEGVADAFERGFTAKMQALKVGDPMDPATEVGPLATRTTLTDLDDQVRRSIAAGASLEALRDDRLDAEQHRALGGPVARGAGAVFRAGENHQRRAFLLVAHGRVVDGICSPSGRCTRDSRPRPREPAGCADGCWRTCRASSLHDCRDGRRRN